MFQNDVKFVCEECGEENAYRVDFSETLRKLDEYKLENKKFEYENRNFKYKFELEYPSVRTVSVVFTLPSSPDGINVHAILTVSSEAVTTAINISPINACCSAYTPSANTLYVSPFFTLVVGNSVTVPPSPTVPLYTIALEAATAVAIFSSV
jgi:hypothetical protein